MTDNASVRREMTPWQIDAMEIMETHSLTHAQAANAVILEWLADGSTKPLYDWLLQGLQPDQTILHALAYMLMRGDIGADWDPDATQNPVLARDMKFGLVVRRPGKGAPKDLPKQTRNRLLRREVRKLMAEGVSYDGAIATVHEWYCANIQRIGIQTVRDAYDGHQDL